MIEQALIRAGHGKKPLPVLLLLNEVTRPTMATPSISSAAVPICLSEIRLRSTHPAANPVPAANFAVHNPAQAFDSRRRLQTKPADRPCLERKHWTSARLRQCKSATAQNTLAPPCCQYLIVLPQAKQLFIFPSVRGAAITRKVVLRGRDERLDERRLSHTIDVGHHKLRSRQRVRVGTADNQTRVFTGRFCRPHV